MEQYAGEFVSKTVTLFVIRYWLLDIYCVESGGGYFCD